MPNEVLVCTPKSLPPDLLLSAARTATEINPVNHPPVERMMAITPGFEPTRERIAIVTTRYWGPKGVRLTVGFLDNPEPALRRRIIAHMNAWAKTANVRFVESRRSPQVRIARVGGRDGGYWSYLGTDVLSIPAARQTMNLQGFTMQTPEKEFRRVVRHETGHTLGCPHEHMRAALVKLIDEQKAIAAFGASQGWTPDEVRRQVLTPLEESSLLGTVNPDPKSIMCYQIDGSLTKNGQPIVGGSDIVQSDYAFMATVYPKRVAPSATRPATGRSRRRKVARRKRSRRRA